MSVMNILKSRRAVRNYEPKEVETEKITRLLEAAVWAPMIVCASRGIFM